MRGATLFVSRHYLYKYPPIIVCGRVGEKGLGSLVIQRQSAQVYLRRGSHFFHFLQFNNSFTETPLLVRETSRACSYSVHYPRFTLCHHLLHTDETHRKVIGISSATPATRNMIRSPNSRSTSISSSCRSHREIAHAKFAGSSHFLQTM